MHSCPLRNTVLGHLHPRMLCGLPYPSVRQPATVWVQCLSLSGVGASNCDMVLKSLKWLGVWSW